MPRDIHNMTLVSLFIIGAGVLFPWNALISAPDYFTKFHEFVDASYELSSAESNLWDNILTYFTVSFSCLNQIGQAFIIYMGSRFTISPKVIYSIFSLFVVMILVPVLSYVHMSPPLAFALLVTIAGICGLATAFFQATSFGLGAMFPPEFTQAVMVGNACAGLTVASLRLITKSAGGTARANGAIYFYLASSWLVVSLACFVVMRKLRFAQKYVDEFSVYTRLRFPGESETAESTASARSASVPPAPLLVPATKEELEKLSQPLSGIDAAESHGAHPRANRGSSTNHDDPASASDSEDTGPVTPLLTVYKAILPMSLSVFLSFVVTIGVFPGAVSRIPSSFSDGWYTVWLIFTFNLTDMFGRYAPSLYTARRELVPVFSVVRLAFVPLVLFCVEPRIFHAAWIPILIVAGVGTTNGYTASLAMMYGPSSASLAPKDRERAGTIMSFSLLSGITVGSFVGLLISNFLPEDSSGSGSG
ncbi:Nucleoside transporter FUN26 [Diplonema papillatum]|nr:Nucleoside transporter FUN26 [Diplonema papillatum]